MTRSITADFAWFTRVSFTNIVRRFTKRIRSPRYAIAVALGGLYFFFVLVMPLMSKRHGHSPMSDGGPIMALARSVGPLGLLLLAASWWLWRTDREGIALTPAETNMLVPAPITRRQLIQFKLMRTQIGIMMSAVITTLVTHTSEVPMPLRFIAFWVLLATMQMHRFGASLVHTALAEQGRSGVRRVWLAVVIFAAVIVAIACSLFAQFAHTPLSATGFTAALDRPFAHAALIPFRAVMAAVNAHSAAEWNRTFWIALAIAALHYMWVIRMDAAFEEGAAAAGAKRAAAVEAARAGRAGSIRLASKPIGALRPAWFPLPAAGPPAVAVLWKNAIAVTRGVSRRAVSILATFAFIIVALTFTKNPSGHGPPILLIIGSMAGGYAGIFVLMGPMAVRHDFRSELRRLELIRALPVGGPSLAAAEITTSALVVTFMQLILATVSLVCLHLAGRLHHAHMIALLAVPVIVLAIGLNATMVTLHNVFAVMYPAWARGPGGIEMFGIAMLTMLASLILLVLSLIGPALVGLAAAATGGMQWGARAWIPGGVGFIAGLFVQLYFLIALLGRSYDRMDYVNTAS